MPASGLGRIGPQVLPLVLPLLALVVLAVGGCFEPRQPGCAFRCGVDGLCPEQYVCGDDGICHREDGQGMCDLPPQTDASADGSSNAEAGSDGPVDAAGTLDGADDGGPGPG